MIPVLLVSSLLLAAGQLLPPPPAPPLPPPGVVPPHPGQSFGAGPVGAWTAWAAGPLAGGPEAPGRDPVPPPARGTLWGLIPGPAALGGSGSGPLVLVGLLLGVATAGTLGAVAALHFRGESTGLGRHAGLPTRRRDKPSRDLTAVLASLEASVHHRPGRDG